MKKILFLSLALLMSLSVIAQDLLSKIPKDAAFVSVLKGSKVLKHVAEKELMQYHFTNEFFSHIDDTNTFEELGVDLHRNFYFFTTLTDSISYNCVLMPLKSAKKLSSLLGENKDVLQLGDYKGVRNSSEITLWDESAVLFVSSFGHATKAPDYGMIREIEEDEAVAVEIAAVEGAKAAQSSTAHFDQYDILEKVVTVLDDKQNLQEGKVIFEKNCTACHLKDGGGLIGPNHTDEYWLYGGSPKQIFHTIANGVPSKGMISWKSTLSPREIQQVMSYVRTLKGTTPKKSKDPQGEKYDRSMESTKMKEATVEEQVAFIMNGSDLTGNDRHVFEDGITTFLYENSGIYFNELEVVEEEVEDEVVESPRAKTKLADPNEQLLKDFALRVMSTKNGINSMAQNPTFLSKFNGKAVVTAWTNNYGEIYSRMLGLNNPPYLGYPRGMMGTMLNAMRRMNPADLAGVKSITANLFLAHENAEIEVLTEMTDEMADFSRQMSKRKFNKDFFRYFDGDKVMGYWGLAVNVENSIDVYPKLVSSIVQKIMPEQKEEAALGVEFLSIVLDAEEIGELINGDLMFVVSDMVEKEIKYMSYEYDDDFNATKVEKTKTESIPEFLFMMSTEKASFFKKFMRLGEKYKVIEQQQKNLYKIASKGSKFPMELYVALQDDILFIASSEYQARDIANGKKGKISRKHKRKAKKKNMIFYANNDAIIDAVPTDFLSPNDAVRLDYFQRNFQDFELSSYKIKGNITKTNMKINTGGAEINALQSFFGMFDQFFIN